MTSKNYTNKQQKKWLLLTALFLTIAFANSALAQTTYYSKAASTDFNDLNSWGANTDGSGAAPISISNADNFVIQNASVMSLTTSADVRQLTINAGSLTVTANTLTVSIAAAYNSTLSINSGGTLTVSGGTLNLNGNFVMAAGGTFSQSSGAVNVDGNNAGSATGSVASGTNIVNWGVTLATNLKLTGGTFTIVDPHYTTTVTFNVNYAPIGDVSASTNHTFRFGDGVSTDAGGALFGFRYYSWNGSGIFRFGNVIIETVTAGANRFVSVEGTYYNFVVLGDVTINSGGELRNSGTSTTTGATVLAGNLTVNVGGTYTSTAGTYLGNTTSASSTTLTFTPSTNAQTISGGGTFKNATTGATANFTSLLINNTHNSGVTFSGANTLLSGTNTGTVSGTLTLTNGLVNTGGNPFVLGVSGTTLGTLTYTAGGFSSGSTFGRWIGTTGTGTTIAASAVPTFGTGSFPFVMGNATSGFSANHFHKTTAALTTAGIFSVTYNGVSGVSALSPVSENSLTFDNQTNASWTVSTSPTYASSANHSFAIQGFNTYTAFSTNARLLIGGTLVGTHQAGTSQPMVERTAIPAASISGIYTIGMIGSELPNQTVASGAWDNAAVWSLGVPVCGQNVVINTADSIWITGATTSANTTYVVINGKLSVSGSSLSVGCANNNSAFVVNGRFYVSGGTVNINGNLSLPSGSVFSHTGGNINVDGNAGVLANSVASGTPLVSIATSNVKLSGGILTIVDPHAGTTDANGNRAFYYTGTTAIDTTFGWTLKFGDGVSTTAGGAVATPVGFVLDMAGSKIVIDSLVIDAGLSGTNRFVALNNGTTVGCNAMYITTNGEARISSATYISGNLTNNGTLTNTAGAVTFGTFLTSTAGASSKAQVISGSGIFRNLVTSPTANFTTLTINNTNLNGVTFATANTLLSGSNTGTVSGTFTLTKGIVNTGSNVFILGNSVSSTGTLTYTNGNGGFGAGSTFSRWWGTAVSSNTITAATVPTAGVGSYPFATIQLASPLTYNSRTAYIKQAAVATTGGTIAVKYNDAAGLVAASITDGAYTIDNKTNANWQVTATGITGTPTYTLALSGESIYLGGNGNSRIALASSSIGGTHQAGTVLPHSQRLSVPLSDMNSTWYLGVNNNDIAFVSVASGAWENPAIWNKGVAPTCSDSVTISNGHIVTINANAATARAVSINTTGQLTISGSTLTVGCTMNNATLRVSGKLLVSSGTVTINGGLVNNPSGKVHQSGGSIIVDANDNGNAATSYASHIVDMYATTDSSVLFTGGTFTIVDPPATGTGASFKVYPSQPVNFGTNHTLIFGNGVSTAAGVSGGFQINLFNTGTSIAMLGNLVINTNSSGAVNRYVTTTNDIGILGNLTITSGSYRMASAHYVKGNIVNNDSLINTSTLNMADYTSAVVKANNVAQSITGTGKLLNSATAPTAGMSSLTINNNSTGGVTLGTKISVSGTLTLTRGIVNTNATDSFRLGTNTAAGTLSGAHDSAYISGPFYRTFAASRTASGTYSAATLYPGGKGGRYLPLWIDPTTTAAGPVVLSGESFNTNSGSLGAGATFLSANRWQTFVAAGNANFTSANIQLTDTAAAFTTSTKILVSTAASGAYVGILPTVVYTAGPPKTVRTTGTQILASNYSGYFAYGELTPCAIPFDQPNSFATANLGSTSFDGSYAVATSAPSHYLVVRYATGATVTAPSNNTSYAVAATLGVGTVVANTTGTTFAQTGLTANTTYDYYIYAYNNSACFGPVYNTTSPLMASVATCATAVTTPTSALAVAVTSSGFTARWSKNASPTAIYLLDISTNSGFTSYLPGYQAVSTNSDTFAVVSGLPASTQYYYRVRTVDGLCSSPLSANQTVSTLCNAITVFPFLDNFGPTLNSCALSVTADGNNTYKWEPVTTGSTHGAAAPQAGTHYLRLYVFLANPAGSRYDYVLPQMNLGTSPKILKYQYWLGNTGYTNSPIPLTIFISSNGGTNWDTLYKHTTANSTFATTVNSSWNANAINLSAYTGNVIIKFSSVSNYGSGMTDQGLDEIFVGDLTAPKVLNSSATIITQSSTTLGGSILADGNSTITSSGVVYGTGSNPVIGGQGVVDSTTIPLKTSGSFSFNLQGLAANTVYHYRSYAINAIGTSYGGDSIFTTLSAPILATINSTGASLVAGYNATVGGNIISNGGDPVSVSGIVYGTSPGPAIGGSGVVDSITNPAVANGMFVIKPTGLMPATKYYFRAYAINVAGTSYSLLDSFTTLTVINSFPYTQNFESGAASWNSVMIGTANNWVLGTPAKAYLSGANSGVNAWVTKLTGNYDINTDGAVVSPQLDFSSFTTTPVLRFNQKFTTEQNWDAMVVEMSINNGAWTKVSATVGTGNNLNTDSSYAWYSSNSTNGLVPPKFASTTTGQGSDVLYLSQNNGWIQSAAYLRGATGQNNVKIRFHFTSDNTNNAEGFAIDDIEVVEIAPSPTNPASAVTLSSITTSGMNVGWTNGNGQGRLVVARLTTTAPVAPVNNKLYRANPVFGALDSTGLGNYVIYSGTGSSVVSTGLANLTDYTYDVYEYNGKYMHINFAGASSNNAPTPVKLTSFTVTAKGNDALLNWTTASETNNKGFEIERSANGRTFEKINFVNGAGNSSKVINYNLVDKNVWLPGVSEVYYRLKQVDFDGKYAYSQVVRVNKNVKEANALSVFPNPYSNDYSISFTAINEGSATVEMMDLQGKVVAVKNAAVVNGVNTISMNEASTVRAGIYFVRININGEMQTLKLVKN
jgi:hypothetical protein